jgi:hypothetical protein
VLIHGNPGKANVKKHAYSRRAVGRMDQSPSQEVEMIFVIAAFLLFSPPAVARDSGQWANQPPAVRQWFQTLMQPDDPTSSCCGEADAFEADSFEVQDGEYVAIITNGKGEIPEGTRIPVPNTKIKWDKGNPTGHGIIFIGNFGEILCYVTPGGV